MAHWLLCGVSGAMVPIHWRAVGGKIVSGGALGPAAATALGTTGAAAAAACGKAGNAMENSRVLKNGWAKFTGDEQLLIEAHKIGLINSSA